MKAEGYTKLLFGGVLIVILLILVFFVIDPITDWFEQIIKTLEGIGH